MRSTILSFVFLITVAVFSTIVNAAIPANFPLKNNYETEFAFQSNTKISFGVAQLQQKYNYNIIVRKSSSADQLLVSLENPEVNDRLGKPKKNDLDALQLPFLVNVNSDGEWVSIVTSPSETKISLEQKENIATMLTYNETDNKYLSSELKKLPANEPFWVVDETPLGDCSSQNTLETNDESEIIYMKATRSNCTGTPKGGLLDNFGIDISSDSEFEYHFVTDKTNHKFTKAELSIKMGVLTAPPADVKVQQQLNFVKYREITNDIDVSGLTEVHTVEELEQSSSNSLF